jgi:hypothetical protein
VHQGERLYDADFGQALAARGYGREP